MLCIIMKKIQNIIGVSIFALVFFTISFGQSSQIESSQNIKIAIVYSNEFSDAETGIKEFVLAIQKVEDKFKVENDDLNDKYEEVKNLAKKILIVNNCHENCKVGETEALINELEKRNCNNRSEQNRLKKEIEKYSNEILEPVKIKIKASLKSFAKSKGFGIVLDGSLLKESAILTDWSELPIITKEFIKFYNESFDKEHSQ